MKKIVNQAVFLTAFALSIPHAQATEPLELQKVMKELGRNMQVITDGISREDWESVARTAPLIATHPQPPVSEKMRIMKFMGTEMPKFKAFDGETHKAAHELEQAAHENDGQKIIATFGKLQTTCLNCHQTFRGKIVQYFYGQESKQPSH